MIVIGTLELHCHVCSFNTSNTLQQNGESVYNLDEKNYMDNDNRSEIRPIEYEIWSDSSNEDLKESKELIEEEEDNMLTTTTELNKNILKDASLTTNNQFSRPDSLGVIASTSKNCTFLETQQVIITKVN